MLAGGNVADCTAGAKLLDRFPDREVASADKGYDPNAIRRQVADRGAMANILLKAHRKGKNCLSPFLYRNGGAIERMSIRRAREIGWERIPCASDYLASRDDGPLRHDFATADDNFRFRTGASRLRCFAPCWLAFGPASQSKSFTNQ